jgi:hypothetical protein
MQVRHKVALASVLIVAATTAAWHFVPEGGPVSVAFVRYERAGKDRYAYMELRNNASRPVSYRSSGITSTHYIWDSPQIDYAWRLDSRMTTLPPQSNSIFRVLMITTEHNWRVGVDYEIGPPSWSALLPRWLVDRMHRMGIIRRGTHRAWSPRVNKPEFHEDAYPPFGTDSREQK